MIFAIDLVLNNNFPVDEVMTAIYNQIGNGYDTTRCADPEILSAMARLLSVRKDGLYIDIGCGTGNYTVELARLGGEWHAFDQSELMITQAKAKSSLVQWSIFDVEQTSYSSNSFHAALCSLAIHHFADLGRAFAEVARLLQPSGKFVVFTSLPEQMNRYWLNHYFPNMLARSVEQMPLLDNIQCALHAANLRVVEIERFSVSPTIKDLFLYSGKYQPEIYLSQSVRSGISSFRNLCSEAELQSGLLKLKADIETGKIESILNNYANDLGDYCFIVAEKNG
ncbi:putative MerR-family transcriptional regulator [Cellvibrio sp. BR]|nr:putative MerR-family transcriptional regulator [Cellvibrio sp. BR]